MIAEEEKLSATAQRFCRRFSLDQIRLATQDFSEDHLIGNGGFGKVYKGQLDNGEESTVAIKRVAINSKQGESEFLTEIETLSKLRHINLVSLIGYCNDNEDMILVYDYIRRGTLAENLYTTSMSTDSEDYVLSWKQRLNVCVGAARGLDYLHTGTSIIHRDVKSTNILLDENFRAKVSDFGLAKHLSTINPQSHVSTVVKGSFGYLDPSYFTTCRLTRQSDTYAFGVVLLEVLCGRPAVDPRLGEDEMSLVMWAQHKIGKGKVGQIVASNIREEITPDCLKTFVGIARRCLNHDPKKRPTMARVLGKLELALEQQDRKAQTLIALRFFPFLNGILPIGSTQENHDRAAVNTPSEANPATQEDAWKDEQNFTSDDKLGSSIAAIKIPLQVLTDMTHISTRYDKIGHEVSREVYCGVLESGKVAAIKMLTYNCLPEREFLEQVSIASNLKHENVSPLLGYCVTDGQHFLAYELPKNGTLYDALHGHEHTNDTKPVPALSWGQRVKIALGVAKGLEYLHQKEKIHRNIRSSNILLFDDYKLAKLSDFGWFTESPYPFDDYLAYYHPGVFEHPRGYHPLEYVQLGEQSSKTDVYSFGVLLLELLTGRQVNDGEKYKHIVEWRNPWIGKDWVKSVVDARLNGAYSLTDASKMAEVAAMCVQKRTDDRPDMDTVISALSPLLHATSA